MREAFMWELRKAAEFLCGLRYDDLPESVVEAAVHCIIDTVSVAGGAANEKLVYEVRRSYLSTVGNGEGRSASVVGTTEKTNVFCAAFLNALAGHFYELDDVHCESKTHIGTVVIPAAYALAEAIGASGKDLILAIVCGYELTARIGMAFGVTAHRQCGWHSTSTAGVFGSAVACAKLLRLNQTDFANALGMAGTQAFGRWAFLAEGATCKILHPARAAASGCEAAFLAKAGMSGPQNILMAEDGGLLTAMSDSPIAEFAIKDFGTRWEILNMDNKPYPCCRSTHGSIDAALALKKEYAFSADEIESVDIETYHIGKVQCAESEGSLHPKTQSEAKFSTPYAVSCALLYGGVNLQDFKPENVLRKEPQELLQKVHVEESAEYTNAYPKNWGCSMKIRLYSGKTYHTALQDASGSKTAPLSLEQLLQKSRQLLSPVQGLQVDTFQRAMLELPKAERVPTLISFFA